MTLEKKGVESLLDPFNPVLVGDNECYIIRAYFPKDILNDILPGRLSIPGDDVMSQNYPGTTLKENEHPFAMFFCHGSDKSC